MCVVEFDRAPVEAHRAIGEALKGAGYEVIGSAVAADGPKEFASEVRIRKKVP